MQPPQFEFYDPQTPIYTSPRFLPPAKIVGCKVNDVIISHGSYLEECTIENAIIGLRSRVGKGAVIQVPHSSYIWVQGVSPLKGTLKKVATLISSVSSWSEKTALERHRRLRIGDLNPALGCR